MGYIKTGLGDDTAADCGPEPNKTTDPYRWLDWYNCNAAKCPPGSAGFSAEYKACAQVCGGNASWNFKTRMCECMEPGTAWNAAQQKCTSVCPTGMVWDNLKNTCVSLASALNSPYLGPTNPSALPKGPISTFKPRVSAKCGTEPDPNAAPRQWGAWQLCYQAETKTCDAGYQWSDAVNACQRVGTVTPTRTPVTVGGKTTTVPTTGNKVVTDGNYYTQPPAVQQQSFLGNLTPFLLIGGVGGLAYYFLVARKKKTP